MDPVRNPYTPNAGSRPPLLAGRDQLLENFALLVDRVAAGRPEKGFVVTGLRGVGKTVLLGEFETIARSKGAVVVAHEVPKEPGALSRRFPAMARKALLEVSPTARWGDRAKRAASILRAFKAHFDPDGRWSITFDASDVPSVEGVGDSGDLTMDLPDVMEALGEAALAHQRIIVFLIDEIQHLDTSELSALVMAKHRVNQRQLPVVIAGAGLPQLPGLTADAKTYAERMFSWPKIGSLPPESARLALLTPALREGVGFEEAALSFIVEYTEGFPFFLQEFGRAVWDATEDAPITLQDAEIAQPTVEAVLDQDFYSVRVANLPDREISYIKAMSGLGAADQAVGDVATAMGVASASLIASAQTRLTDRGLIYSPRRGFVAFTVPQFDRYVRRAFPD
jgi:hypothetical protein